MLRGGLGPIFLGCLVLIFTQYTVFARANRVPVLDSHSVNVTRVAGHTAILPCSVSHLHGTYQVTWMKDSNYLSIGETVIRDSGRLSIGRPYTRDWNLHIANVRKDDSGDYYCSVNTIPKQSKRVHLNIHMSPSIIEHQSSSNVLVEEGSDATLICRVSGNPSPRITWKKLDDPSSGDLLHVGETVKLENVTRDHRGRYKCTAENGISPQAVWTVPLDVEFGPSIDIEDDMIIVSRGQTAVLKCLVNASPHKHFIWKHFSNELGPDDSSWKYKQEICEADGSTRTMCLTVYDIDRSDYGDYTCESTNRLGTKYRHIVLAEFIPTTTTTTTPVPSITTDSPDDNGGGVVVHNKTTDPPYNVDKTTSSPDSNDGNKDPEEISENNSSIAASAFRHCWTLKYQKLCIFLVFIQHLLYHM